MERTLSYLHFFLSPRSLGLLLPFGRRPGPAPSDGLAGQLVEKDLPESGSHCTKPKVSNVKCFITTFQLLTCFQVSCPSHISGHFGRPLDGRTEDEKEPDIQDNPGTLLPSFDSKAGVQDQGGTGTDATDRRRATGINLILRKWWVFYKKSS